MDPRTNPLSNQLSVAIVALPAMGRWCRDEYVVLTLSGCDIRIAGLDRVREFIARERLVVVPVPVLRMLRATERILFDEDALRREPAGHDDQDVVQAKLTARLQARRRRGK